jgi:glycosyltransferase 2 family protein
VAARRLTRHVVLAAALGAAIALGLALAANFAATLEALRRFRWTLIPLILAAVVTNWALRFLKWHLYLRRLGIPLRAGPSGLVFLGGFTMAISPGKFGEVLKAVLVRNLVGTEVSRTASVVMAERLTDVAGLVLLSGLGATALPHGPLVLGALSVLVVLTVLFLRSPALARCARRFMPDHRLVLKVAEPLRGFLGAGHALVAPGILVLTVGLSVVSWFFECLAFYLILQGLGVTVPLRVATVVYAFASLAGAVSMLPGGLGVAEGSLTGLLATLGAPLPLAAAATLLVRAVSLWLAVGLGVATLALAFHGEPEDAATRVG